MVSVAAREAVGVASEHERAERFLELASHAGRHGLGVLGDDDLLAILKLHRWAVRRLAEPHADAALRSLLSAGVVSMHGLLHRRSWRWSARALGRAVRGAGGTIALSASVFITAALLGAVAVTVDPVLAFALVPHELLAQIGADAWSGRGGAATRVGMTLFYWANNLRASFMALGLGVLGSVPALAIVAFNGLLLGAVAGVAVQHGVGDRLLGWVAPHGVPEIGGLVLSGAIGFELGRSLRAPGEKRRRDAVAERGRELAPLAIFAAILVLCAAPLEGFVAPLELPRWVDLGIATGWLLVLGAGAVTAARAAVARPGAR